MNRITRRSLTVITAMAAALAIAACGSESGSEAHDHSTHAPAAGHDDHAGHDHAGSGAAAELERMTPSADYPLTTCVVSGETLGDMGDPVAVRYEGREVQFCCEACIAEFQESPATFLAKLDAAGGR